MKESWKRWLIAAVVIVFLWWAIGIPFAAFVIGLLAGVYQGWRIRSLLRLP